MHSEPQHIWGWWRIVEGGLRRALDDALSSQGFFGGWGRIVRGREAAVRWTTGSHAKAFLGGWQRVVGGGRLLCIRASDDVLPSHVFFWGLAAHCWGA